VNGWPIVKLSDVATLSSGGTPSKANPAFWDGQIPWVSPKDMKTNCIDDAMDKITAAAVAQSAAKIVGPSSVLAVVRSGILAHTFPVAMVSTDVSFNQDIKGITPKNGNLLPGFVFWMLKAQEQYILAVGVKKGATVHSLSNGFLEALHFSLPPIGQQNRIINLMGRAAEIRRDADAARAKARAIIPALFLDTFGDPGSNPKNWPIVEIGDLLERIDSGWSPTCGEGLPVDNEWAVLKLSAVKAAGFDANEAKPLPNQSDARPELGIQLGDLLFTRKNTLDLVGTASIVEGPSRYRMLPDTIFRLVPTEARRFSAEYLCTLINLATFRPAIHRLASGSAASMPGISKARLKTLRIPLPPTDLQFVFAERVQRIRALACLLDAAEMKAKMMAAALSAEVFSTSVGRTEIELAVEPATI
jgi:type I restriction enzyme S subunit